MRSCANIREACTGDTEKQIGRQPAWNACAAARCAGYALVQGRTYVVPEDFKEIAHYVLQPPSDWRV